MLIDALGQTESDFILDSHSKSKQLLDIGRLFEDVAVDLDYFRFDDVLGVGIHHFFKRLVLNLFMSEEIEVHGGK